MTDEKADLDQLLTSAGWLRFETTQTAFWQGQLSDLLAAAAGDRDDAIALGRLRQVIAAQRAVLQALAWPRERLKQLTKPAPVETFSRGGYDPAPTR